MPKPTCKYNQDCYRLNPEHFKKYHHDHYGDKHQQRLSALMVLVGNDPDQVTDHWFKNYHLHWRVMGFTDETEQLQFFQFILDKLNREDLTKLQAVALIQLFHTMEEDNIRAFGDGLHGEPLSNIWLVDKLREQMENM